MSNLFVKQSDYKVSKPKQLWNPNVKPFAYPFTLALIKEFVLDKLKITYDTVKS